MSTLIFTIAQNGYGIGYSQCLHSHARYAERLGATYVAVTRPFRVAEPALCSWLKIPLLLRAVRAGYDWIAFIDGDCRVHDYTPDFRHAWRSERSVFMTKGRSGRVNAGVIFAKGDRHAAHFFEQVMSSLTVSIPEQDRRGTKYENGNVIYCTSRSEYVEVIDTRWNNTYQLELDDYLRHYTGPLREEYKRSWLATAAFKVAKTLAGRPSPAPETRDAAFVQRLDDLAAQCAHIYPSFERRVSETGEPSHTVVVSEKAAN
jgi:hypothetical protein